MVTPMGPAKDVLAAVVLTCVLFGTAALGLGLGPWLTVVVPLCTLAWLCWVVATTPHRPRSLRHLHLWR